MKNIHTVNRFFRSYRREIRFFILFCVFFASLNILHYFTGPYTAPLLIHRLNADVSAFIITTCAPSEQVSAHGPVIRSGDITLTVEKGCDGIAGMLLLTAAMLAFPARWKKKAVGIVAGVALMYVANLLRIILLYFTFKYHSDMFDIMHTLIGQTVIIFVGVLFFAFWTDGAGGNSE